MKTLENKLIQLLSDLYGKREFLENIDYSANLIEEIPELDSMGIVSLITALEENFDIEFDDEDIIIEHFENLGTLLALVNNKKAH